MVKALVCGTVRGELEALHARVDKLNSSKFGPFDVLFVVGGLLATSDDKQAALAPYVSGDKTFPIPVYVLAGADAAVLPAGTDGATQLCTNISQLSRVGCATLAGLSVAWLSGTFDALAFGEAPASTPAHYTKADVEVLLAAATPSVDLFLSSEWASGVHTHLPADVLPLPEAAMNSAGSLPIRMLAHKVQPRYHFAAGESVFFQRLPYTNGPTAPVTRFLGLAPVGAPTTDKSKKYLHALNLVPAAEVHAATLVVQPAGTTPNPYAASTVPAVPPTVAASTDAAPPAKRVRSGAGASAGAGAGAGAGAAPGLTRARMAELQAEASTQSQSQFFFSLKKMGGRGGGGGRGPGGGPGGARGPPPEDYTCHRCNEKGHWIQDCPMKREAPTRPPPRNTGPIRTECWFCLASPSLEKHLITSIGTEAYMALPKGGINDTHVLIVPVEHHSSVAAAPPALVEEIESYKSGLRSYFGDKGEVAVFFERVVKTRGAAHTHIQVVGVPAALAKDVQARFEAEGSKHDMVFRRLAPDASLNVETKGSHYFYVELPNPADTTQTVRLVHLVSPDVRHPLQFGREVLCGLMGLPDRVHWKDCATSQDEEKKLAMRFRKAFSKYDFTRKK